MSQLFRGYCAQVVGALLLVSALLVQVLWSSAALGQQIAYEQLLARDWLHIQSKNVDVVSDLGAKEAREMIEKLEEYAAFCQLILSPQTPGASKPTSLFVTDSNYTWESLGQQKMLVSARSLISQHPTALVNLGSGLAGRSNKSVAARTDIYKVIATRELQPTQYGQELPFWYREGMSLYMPTFHEDKGRLLLGGIESLDEELIAVIKSDGGDNGYNSKNLFQRTQAPQPKSAESTSAYLEKLTEFQAQAFMTAHFFNSSVEYKERTSRFLLLLDYGHSAESALSKAYGWSFEQLNSELENYAHGRLYARAFDKGSILTLIEQKNGPILKGLKISPLASEVALMNYVKLFEVLDFDVISNFDKNVFAKKVVSALNEQGIKFGSNDIADLDVAPPEVADLNVVEL